MTSHSSPSWLAARLLDEESDAKRRGPIARWRAARLNRRLARVDFGALMAALHHADAGKSSVRPPTYDPQPRGRSLAPASPHTVV
jgi:hypothetical protein